MADFNVDDLPDLNQSKDFNIDELPDLNAKPQPQKPQLATGTIPDFSAIVKKSLTPDLKVNINPMKAVKGIGVPSKEVAVNIPIKTVEGTFKVPDKLLSPDTITQEQQDFQLPQITRELLPLDELLTKGTDYTRQYLQSKKDASQMEFEQQSDANNVVQAFNREAQVYQKTQEQLKQYADKYEKSLGFRYGSDFIAKMKQERDVLQTEISQFEKYTTKRTAEFQKLNAELEDIQTRYQNGEINEQEAKPAYEAKVAQMKAIESDINTRQQPIKEKQSAFDAKLQDENFKSYLTINNKLDEIQNEAQGLITRPEFKEYRDLLDAGDKEQAKKDAIKKAMQKKGFLAQSADALAFLGNAIQNPFGTAIDLAKGTSKTYFGTKITDEGDKLLGRTLKAIASIGKALPEDLQSASPLVQAERLITGQEKIDKYGFFDKMFDQALEYSKKRDILNPVGSDVQRDIKQSFADVNGYKVLLDNGKPTGDVRDANFFKVDDKTKKEIQQAYAENPSQYKTESDFSVSTLATKATPTILDMGTMMAVTAGTGGSSAVMVGTSAAQMYSDMYETGLQAGLKPSEANDFATLTSIMTGMVTLVNPMESNIVRGTVSKNIGKILGSSITKADIQLIRSGEMTIGQLAKRTAIEGLKNTAGENLEELVLEPFVQKATETLYNGKAQKQGGGFETDWKFLQSKEDAETAMITTMTSLLLTPIEVANSIPEQRRLALQRSLENPEQFLTQRNLLLESDGIDKAKFDYEVKAFEEISKQYNAIKPEIKEDLHDDLAELLLKKYTLKNTMSQVGDDVLNKKNKIILDDINSRLEELVSGTYDKAKETAVNAIKENNAPLVVDETAVYNGQEVTIVDDFEDGNVLIDIGNDAIVVPKVELESGDQSVPVIDNQKNEQNGKIQEAEGQENVLNTETQVAVDGVGVSPAVTETLDTETSTAKPVDKKAEFQRRLRARNLEKKKANENPITPVEPVKSGQEQNDGTGLQQTPENDSTIQSGSEQIRQEVPTEKVEEGVKPIRQLGTGSNVYFETPKYRVNDFKGGKVLLNINGTEDGGMAIANVEFDNPNEAVFVAKELARIYPNGVPNAVLIDKVVNEIKEQYANPTPTPKAETTAILDEIKSKNLTHVKGKNMGENQALGTFISTEKGNRYETPTQKAEQVEIDIQNPFVVDNGDFGLVDKRQEILNANRDKFDELDTVDYQKLPTGKLTVDNLNDAGIKKLAELTTNELKSQGYDGIYFRESDTQEGELVVFDKEKVKFKGNNVNLVEDKAENEYVNNKLADQDNVEQEPSIKDIEGKAESNNEAELNEVVKKADELINGATDVVNVPTADIKTNEKEYQGRKNKFSERSAKNVANNFDKNKFDPIVVYNHPDGNTYVLSGHSRLEGMKRRGETTIPARIFEGTPEQAKEFALKSNKLGTLQTDLENAGYYREERKKGKSYNSLLEEAKENEQEGSAKRIISIAHLNPDGKAIQLMEQMQGAEGDGSANVTNIATKIGDIRAKNEHITDEHENELFDYMMQDKDNIPTDKQLADSNSPINRSINAVRFDNKEPLNLEKFQNKSDSRIQWEKEKKELEQQISDLRKEVNPSKSTGWTGLKEKAIASIAKDKSQDAINKAEADFNNNVNGIKDNYQKLLEKKREELTAVSNRLAKHLLAEKNLIEGEKNQQSLFQSTDAKFEEIDKTAFEKLIDKLKKAFPNVSVELFGKGNMDSAKKALDKYGLKIVDLMSIMGNDIPKSGKNAESILIEKGFDAKRIKQLSAIGKIAFYKREILGFTPQMLTENEFHQLYMIHGTNFGGKDRGGKVVTKDELLTGMTGGWVASTQPFKETSDKFEGNYTNGTTVVLVPIYYVDDISGAPKVMKGFKPTESEIHTVKQGDYTPFVRNEFGHPQPYGLDYEKIFGFVSEKNVQFLRTPNGTIYGFKTPDGKVFINTDKLNANTPIHEYGHIWQSVFPQEFAKGIALLVQSPQGRQLISEIRKNPAYKNKTTAEIQAEALVTAIGNKGESIFNSNPTLFNKFKEWLSDFFKKLGDKLGLGTLSPNDKLNMFTKKVAGELLGGKELSKNVGENSDIDLQIIGEKGATELDKQEEVTTRLDNLSVARQMEKANKTPKEIRLATGWEKGADKLWRYEISDFEFKDKINFVNALLSGESANFKLSDIIDSKNEILNAYPELADYNIKIISNEKSKTNEAYFNPFTKTITFNSFRIKTEKKGKTADEVVSESDDLRGLRRVIGHELAHAVQGIEGFAKGGSPLLFSNISPDKTTAQNQLKEISNRLKEDNYTSIVDKLSDLRDKELIEKLVSLPIWISDNMERYRKLSGEVEARSVALRTMLSKEERVDLLLSETEDVSRENQIAFLYNDGLSFDTNGIDFQISKNEVSDVVADAKELGLSYEETKALLDEDNIDYSEQDLKDALGEEINYTTPPPFNDKKQLHTSDGQLREKAVLNRAYNGEDREEIKAKIEELNLMYEVENQESVVKKVNDLIAEIGIDAAYESVRNNKDKNAVDAVIFDAKIRSVESEMATATGDRYEELITEQARLYDEMGAVGKDMGRFISMLGHIYRTTDLAYSFARQKELYKSANNGDFPKAIEIKYRELEEAMKSAQTRIAELEKEKREIEEKYNGAISKDEVDKLIAEAYKASGNTKVRTIKRERIGVHGKDRVARGLDNLATIIGAKLNAEGLDRPSLVKALTDIGFGLMEQGIATTGDVIEKIKEYVADKFGDKFNIEGYESDIINEINRSNEDELARKIKAKENEISKLQEKLNNNDLTKQGKKQTVTSPELEALIEQKRLLTDELAQRRKNDEEGNLYTNTVNKLQELSDNSTDKKIPKEAVKSGLISDLIESYINDGTPLAEIQEKVVNELGSIFPNSDVFQIRDAILRQGDYKTVTKEMSDLRKKLTELKSQLNLQKKIENARQGVIDIARVKGEASPELIKARKELAQARKEAVDKFPAASIKNIEKNIRQTQNRINEINRKTKAGEFDKKKQAKKMFMNDPAWKAKFDELKQKNIEKIKAQYEFDLEQEKARMKNRSIPRKSFDFIVDILGLPKSLVATIDLSAPLRQGVGLGVYNPKEFIKAFWHMHGFATSQKKYDEFFSALKNTEEYQIMTQSGLSITNTTGKADAREDVFMNNLAKKIPIYGIFYKGSERAYSGFLNMLRIDVFNKGIEHLKQQGITFDENPEQYEALARTINNATGRGELGVTGEKIARELGLVFFSPRMLTSRIGMVADVLRPDTPKYARTVALGNVISLTGYIMTIHALGALVMSAVDDEEKGVTFKEVMDKLSFNIIDTDFLKNTYPDKNTKGETTKYDFSTGFSILLRTIARMSVGKKIVRSKRTGEKEERSLRDGGAYRESGADEFSQFIKNKLSPTARVIYSLPVFANQDLEDYKEKFEWGTALKSLVVPLNVKEAIGEDNFEWQRKDYHGIPYYSPKVIKGSDWDANQEKYWTDRILSAYGVSIMTY